MDSVALQVVLKYIENIMINVVQHYKLTTLPYEHGIYNLPVYVNSIYH